MTRDEGREIALAQGWTVYEDVVDLVMAVAEAERKAAELRCLKTAVLLEGLHPYTALKVQEMMSDAVGMRSNVKSAA